ncbi:MAG: hypothetical protein R3264_20065 [Anaerolineae bacterium]|nr:hypothetical protein [Anaerolineae bacterium]
MYKILKLLLPGLIGLFILAACGQAQSADPPASQPADGASEEVVNVAAPADEPAVETEMAAEPVAAQETGLEEVMDEAEVALETPSEAVEAVEPEVQAEVELVEPAAEAAEAPRPDPTDLTAITHTGRPQFLNSFATW